MNAKRSELENWKSNEVFTEVEKGEQKTISLRWVITEKRVDYQQIIKARLVASGFEEEQSDNRIDTPTCYRYS